MQKAIQMDKKKIYTPEEISRLLDAGIDRDGSILGLRTRCYYCGKVFVIKKNYKKLTFTNKQHEPHYKMTCSHACHERMIWGVPKDGKPSPRHLEIAENNPMGRKVLQALDKYGAASTRAVSSALGVGLEAANLHLRRLYALGVIDRKEGPRGFHLWFRR